MEDGKGSLSTCGDLRRSSLEVPFTEGFLQLQKPRKPIGSLQLTLTLCTRQYFDEMKSASHFAESTVAALQRQSELQTIRQVIGSPHSIFRLRFRSYFDRMKLSQSHCKV